MKSLFNEYGINVSDKQIELFEKYYDLLVFYNSKFNITAITERDEVIKKHFIDSALGVNKCVGKKLIDIGSGGGFPAIPLKIMNEDLDVSLLEATGKKCEFLKTVIKELDLKKMKVINNRAELMAREYIYRERFDLCTARAVARLNTLVEYTLPFVEVGGTFIAYKGDVEEELIEAENAIRILGGKVQEVKSYQLDGAKRSLVVIKKIRYTDERFPRGNGKERKSPL